MDEQRSAPLAVWSRARLALIASILIATAPSGVAQASVPVESRGGPIRFDISPRPLSAAIEAYALTTGMQVLYDRPRGEALRSPGVVGLYTREGALRALLMGTGLSPDFTHGDSVVLRPDAARPTAPAFGPPPSDAAAVLSLDTLEVRSEPVVPAVHGGRLDLKLYAGLVGSAVHQALRRDRDLASGRYAMTLKLWIGSSGAVERLTIAGSTGDRDRDLTITAVVGRVVVAEPPPADLPQPVVLIVRSRPGA